MAEQAVSKYKPNIFKLFLSLKDDTNHYEILKM